MPLWWLTIHDRRRTYLGVAIVAADNPGTAVGLAEKLEVDVSGVIHVHQIPGYAVPLAQRGRLLGKDEAEQLLATVRLTVKAARKMGGDYAGEPTSH